MRGFFLPVVALSMFGFAVMHVVKANQPRPDLPPPIEPSRNPYAGGVAGSGIVEPKSENISVGSPLSGVVESVAVKVGSHVHKGDSLFALDSRHLKADLAFRRAAWAAAKSQLAKLAVAPRPEEIPPVEAKLREAKANLADAKDLYERSISLVRSAAVTSEEVNRRKAGLNAAEALSEKAAAELALLKKGTWQPDLAIAQAAVDQADAQVQQVETEIKRSVVCAPIEGDILYLNVRPGETVGTLASQTLIIMGDVSVKHVRVDIDENDIGHFRPGTGGQAFPRGDTDHPHKLRFVRVEPYVQPKRSLTGASTERVDTRVLQVIYAVEGTGAGLYIGQQLDVNLDTGPQTSPGR